jgi:hypothetical protein
VVLYLEDSSNPVRYLKLQCEKQKIIIFRYRYYWYTQYFKSGFGGLPKPMMETEMRIVASMASMLEEPTRENEEPF